MKSSAIKIVALLLTACVFLGVTSCSFLGIGEEETTEATTVASKTPLADVIEPANAINYFNVLVAAVKSGDAKVNYYSEYDPKDFECENSDLKAILPTFVKGMKDGFNATFAPGAEGASPMDVLPIKGSESPLALGGPDIALLENDILAIAVNPEPFSRQAEEESKYAADPEYSTEEIILDEDVRKITITLKDEVDPKAGEGLFGKIYNIPDREAIKTELAKLSAYNLVYGGEYEAKYTGCTIYMEIDRTTDQVLKVEFNRNIEVTTKVTGTGAFEGMGEVELKFLVQGTDRYEFVYEETAQN